MKGIILLMIILSPFVKAQIPVIIKENFDRNILGWLEGATSEYNVVIKDGKYSLENNSRREMLAHFTPYIDPHKDFYFEATFTQTAGRDDQPIGFAWGYDRTLEYNSFTISANGNYRILCSDPALGISDRWRRVTNVKPMGQDNKLKVEQKKGLLYFYLNDKLLTNTRSLPWHGPYVSFITNPGVKLFVDDFTYAHDMHINLPLKSEGLFVTENLGPNINSICDEISPMISADGKTLYFTRLASPENLGGRKDMYDIWVSKSRDGKVWSRSLNLGPPINTKGVDNLFSVSTDNNTLLLYRPKYGFAFRHRTSTGWSALEELGIRLDLDSNFFEGCLSPNGKAIIFAAQLKGAPRGERDIYVCLKQGNNKWTGPIHAGNILNSTGEEATPFLAADGHTLYFSSNGLPGYGGLDIFMSRRLSDDWKQWSEPVNLGPGINTMGFDAYYTIPASGEYGYMVSGTNTIGLGDIVRFKLPKPLRPDPVVLISGRVLNAKTQKPANATIHFDDLNTGKEVGEARVHPKTGDYKIALPAGKNYGFHASAAGYLSINENLELVSLKAYSELEKDLFLVPIEIGESIHLRNVFFVQGMAVLQPESYPELNRLVKLMIDNPSIEIELGGHTDGVGDPKANMELSDNRVDTVEAYLVSQGIDSKRISGKGYGATKPIADGSSEASRQLNRRVEFKITKK
jgi:outer membrane protein OmpA-like peptidoglycan-associated protein